jgi:hypothetical protein
MLHWTIDSWFEVIFAKGMEGIVSITVSCYPVKEMGHVPEMWFGKPGTVNGQCPKYQSRRFLYGIIKNPQT